MRNKLKLKSAYAFSNGILFNSSSKPSYTTMVTIDEYQNIKAEWLPIKIARKYVEEAEQKAESQKNDMIKNATFQIIIDILMLIIMLLLFIINPIFVIIAYLLFLIISISFALVQDYVDTETPKFHAAEHMIIKAYSKIHSIPSINELSKYSRFSTKCGSNYVALILIHLIVVLIYLLFKPNIYLCLFICLASIVFKKLGLLNFIQFVTTKPPTERELKVAIVGLRAWIENEKKSVGNN